MPEPEQPEIPYVPPWPKLKVFLLGAVWAVLGGLAPSLVLIVDWSQRWQDPIDWTMVWHLAGSQAILALAAYVRKYKALLTPPPEDLTTKRGTTA